MYRMCVYDTVVIDSDEVLFEKARCLVHNPDVFSDAVYGGYHVNTLHGSCPAPHSRFG